MNTRKIILEVIVVLLIILWVYTGMSKLFEFELFKFQLGKSPYIESMAGIVACALPVCELIVALMLVLKPLRLIGLYASFFMMLLFTGYIYAMLNFSHYTPCSCGGVLNDLSWEAHLVFNIVFTVLALAAILLSVMKSGTNDIQPNNRNLLKHVAQ